MHDCVCIVFSKKKFNIYVLILAICYNKFTLCLLNNIIDLLKAIKFFIYLKSEINLTSLIIKFTNNKLKPKQHLITNPHKTQKKNNNNNKIILKSILTSLSEYPHTSDNTQNTHQKKIVYTFASLTPSFSSIPKNNHHGQTSF